MIRTYFGESQTLALNHLKSVLSILYSNLHGFLLWFSCPLGSALLCTTLLTIPLNYPAPTAQELREPAHRNFETWRILGKYTQGCEYLKDSLYRTYNDEVDALLYFVLQRMRWIDNHIANVGDFDQTAPCSRSNHAGVAGPCHVRHRPGSDALYSQVSWRPTTCAVESTCTCRHSHETYLLGFSSALRHKGCLWVQSWGMNTGSQIA